ncbi:MAG TPA: hypothetical protein VMX54_21835 [Vicinamibacteria bacterium]|nr:hypothetical protein [Vicinamibacteria bacterium]
MSDSELLSALTPVLRVLGDLGVRHYVGGSIASSAHGISRASVDADVIAELQPAQVPAFVSALAATYYVAEQRVRDAVLRRGSFNLIHLETMLKVDVFVAKDRPFEHRALERAREQAVTGADSVPIPLATAEDVVLAKLEWYRRGGETSARQWGDVLGVLRASGPRLDRRYLEDGALELGVADLLARALADSAED